MIDTKVKIAGVEFANPLIAASGTFGFGREYAQLFKLSELGGIALKGLTLEKRNGNEPIRIAETASGILNSVGLQNPGIKEFLQNELPFLQTAKTKIIANINGNTPEEYCALAELLNVPGIDMLELNVSCPNVKKGGMALGVTPKSIEDVTRQVKMHAKKPLIVKLSPNVTNIKNNALAAQQGGADAISVINSLLGMAIDAKTFKPVLNNVTGGLSGPAIKPIALRMVYECAKAVKIPVFGIGGISTGTDVAEFLLAGASAVQIGSANLSDPFAMLRIKAEFENYLTEMKINDIKSLVGRLEI